MYDVKKIYSVADDIYSEAETISPYVVVAQPRRDASEVPAQKLDGHVGLHIDMLGFSHGYIDIAGEKVDVARNYLIEEVLNSGAKYLLFVGEDTVLPYDGFKILHETAEKHPNTIVTGVYYIKASDAMIMVKHNNWITIPNVDPGQLIEAWQTGMDCMLIPVDILRKMKQEEPDIPFCCIVNDNKRPFIGEDNFFVHRIRKHGVKLLVNTDVQCLHIDLADGKYTAHPSVDLTKYFTNPEVKITERHTLSDKLYLDKRWIERLPGGNNPPTNKLQKAIDNSTPIKFNMGSGPTVEEDYIGVDLYNNSADIKADITEYVPPKGIVDEIKCIHVIEHLQHWKVPDMLRNWYESLKVGGELIIETPDLFSLCRNILSSNNEEETYRNTLILFGAVKENLSSPHIWGYGQRTLISLLKQVGFKEVIIEEPKTANIGPCFRLVAIK